MADRIVINTGPLVALARVDLLEMIGKLPFDFVTPLEVCQEIANGITKGYPNAKPAWLTPVALSLPVDRVAHVALDLGEAAVIQLALENSIQSVCIDERKGRLVAQGAGLSVTGSLGLLVRAKKLGLIPALRPVIDKMKNSGTFYDENLVLRVLRGVGE